MRHVALLILLSSAWARADGKADAVLRPTYAKAQALDRAQPMPTALRAEILRRMGQVVANFARPGTKIVYNDDFGTSAMIELDHGHEASELAVSTSLRDGHVITGLGDRLGWRFFPADAVGSSEILRVDRGYDRPGAEWYRVRGGRVRPIKRAKGEALERAHWARKAEADLKELGSR